MELDKLNKILDNHKLWLSSNSERGERANLSSANLRYANLSSADLRSADLRYANLRYANLRSANLSSADLRSADLRYANLRYANLSSADLRYANLRSANLDYSAFPLWCGGLNVNVDDKQIIQLLYHCLNNLAFSKNTSVELKKSLLTKKIISIANKFHRTECERLKEFEEPTNE